MKNNNNKKKKKRGRVAVCEWCKERPGDYDMSPPDREYATMICAQCFEDLKKYWEEMDDEDKDYD